MRAHIVVDGVVVNTVIVERLDALPGTTLVDADLHGGGPGWLWDGDAVSEPPRNLQAEYQAELKTLNEQYRADMQQLQLSWLSATVADGPNVASRQAQITTLIANLKDEFMDNKAALTQKYFPPV